MATSVMPSREVLVARTCQKLLRLALLENVSRLSPLQGQVGSSAALPMPGQAPPHLHKISPVERKKRYQ